MKKNLRLALFLVLSLVLFKIVLGNDVIIIPDEVADLNTILTISGTVCMNENGQSSLKLDVPLQVKGQVTKNKIIMLNKIDISGYYFDIDKEWIGKHITVKGTLGMPENAKSIKWILLGIDNLEDVIGYPEKIKHNKKYPVETEVLLKGTINSKNGFCGLELDESITVGNEEEVYYGISIIQLITYPDEVWEGQRVLINGKLSFREDGVQRTKIVIRPSDNSGVKILRTK